MFSEAFIRKAFGFEIGDRRKTPLVNQDVATAFLFVNATRQRSSVRFFRRRTLAVPLLLLVGGIPPRETHRRRTDDREKRQNQRCRWMTHANLLPGTTLHFRCHMIRTYRLWFPWYGMSLKRRVRRGYLRYSPRYSHLAGKFVPPLSALGAIHSICGNCSHAASAFARKNAEVQGFSRV